ncbi:MAG: hypothetical protein ABH872_02015 [Candidatus Omnitrophota bacterium]
MKKRKKTLIILVFLCFVNFMGYCEYADLVGKRVQLNGPFCWDTLGVAFDEHTHDILAQTLSFEDEISYRRVIYKSSYAYETLRTKKNTKAIVLDVDYAKRCAKVSLFEGIDRGITGWIPLEWLDGNEERPVMSDYLNFY